MADILARQRQIIGSTTDWAAHDLILGDGELAVERRNDNTVRAKIGNGAFRFSEAPYLQGASDALRYRGNANPTLAPPADAAPGDAFTASPGGVVAASWGPPVAGQTVNTGDLLMMDADGTWNIVGAAIDVSQFVTRTELGSTNEGEGAGMVRFLDGGTVQQGVAVAANPTALLAMTSPLPVGAIVRTADGHLYEVAPAAAVNHHLTTAGGVKLYVLKRDGVWHLTAFGAVPGNWTTDTAGMIKDATPAFTAAIAAMKNYETLQFPDGTTYLQNVTCPTGKLGLNFIGYGTFIPNSVVKFLPGANLGFQLAHEAYEFKNLHFRGTDEAGSCLFTSIRNDGYADMDYSFFNCVFTLADRIAYLKGRGLTVDRCLIGKINNDAFFLDFPNPFVPGPPDYIQTREGAFRGFTVRNSRIHNFSSHLFNITAENRENCRGITIVGNHIDGYARMIKGYAQEVNYVGNNSYIGWNSADACVFDLVDSREINIVGNIESNATSDRQIGDEPFIRCTGVVRGLNLLGNTFGRRDVIVVDCTTAPNSRSVRDVVMRGNIYNDCFVTAGCLMRAVGATGLVQGVVIDEMFYESPSGGWQAVIADGNWRNAEVKVRARHSDTIIHNVPNTFSRNNEKRFGAYTGTGAAGLAVFVGWPVREVLIHKNDGTNASRKIQNATSGQPPEITFTNTGFTLSAAANVNTSGSVYYWEAS